MFFAEATESGGAKGAMGNPTHQCTKMLQRGKYMCFDTKLSKSSEKFCLEPCLYHSMTNILEAMNKLFQERHNHTETSIAVKVSRTMQKVEFHLANEGSGLAILSTVLQFWKQSWKWLWSIVVRERISQASVCSWHFPYAFSHDIHRLDRVQNCWRHKGFIAVLLSLYFQAKIRGNFKYRPVHELSEI